MRPGHRIPRLAVRMLAVGGLALTALAACTSVTGPVDASGGPAAGTEVGGFNEGVPYSRGRVLDVHVPTGTGTAASAPAPTVVLLHGCCGDRSDLGKLAEALAAARLVVFNADWAGLDADATFPTTYADVACAIGFARQHTGRFGGDPERLVVAGWSDGAMAAAAVAASGDTFAGDGCLADPEADAEPPLAVAGIGGFYGWTVPVDAVYATPRASRLFGGDPDTAAAGWEAATPYTWLRSAPPTLLLVGTTDPLLDDARRYEAALRGAGRQVRLVTLPPDGDQTLISPRTSEGRRVVAEIAALARASQPPHTSSGTSPENG